MSILNIFPLNYKQIIILNFFSPLNNFIQIVDFFIFFFFTSNI